MAATGVTCVSCGSPFRAGDEACGYCHAARPGPTLDDARVQYAVEAALREDRNHNGIPDVLERRVPPPRVTPARGSGMSAEDMVVVGTIATALFIVGAVIFHYATAPKWTVAQGPYATPTSLLTSASSPAETAFTPAAPLATAPSTRAAPAPRPKPAPAPAPVPRNPSGSGDVGF